MFARFKNWVLNLFKKKPVQTAPVEVVEGTLTNEIIFHGLPNNPPLTVNAIVSGGTLKQRDFFRNAMNVMRHVVISEEFQGRVLEALFTYTEDNPLEIYKKFISGKDLYESLEDKEMDVEVTIYYNKWTNTVGYTYPNTRRTWMNMKYFNTHEYEMMAKMINNVVHEYMHNIGYGHPFNWTKTRDESVPYLYGRIAGEVALEFLGSGRDIASFEEFTNARSN